MKTAQLSSTRRAGWYLIALSLCIFGCEGLVDETYRGEPITSIEGRLSKVELPAELSLDAIRVSLFWSPTGATDILTAPLVEQPAVSVRVSFPGTFRLDVFERPGPEMLDSGGRYGIALIIAFRDANGDGRGQPDEFIGGSPNTVLIYAAEALGPDDTPVRLPLQPGFYRSPLPLACDVDPIAPEPTAQQCGVPLGTACQSSAECGSGICLKEWFGYVFPDGYCVQPTTFDPGPDECVPGDGIQVIFDEDETYYLKACRADDDCPRDGYRCDALAEVCWPDSPVEIQLTQAFCISPLCAVDISSETMDAIDRGAPVECLLQEQLRNER